VEFLATDISPAALRVAGQNVARHDLAGRIELVCTDLLAGARPPFDLVVSNPPYVAHDDPRVEPAVASFEPALALRDVHDGDGLGFYRRLATEIPPLLTPSGAILVEVGEDQSTAVAELFSQAGLMSTIRPDLAGIERMVLSERGRRAGRDVG
jgi:release factor glutamine methyltransferase